MAESDPPLEETETRLLSLVPASPSSTKANPCVVLMTGAHLGELHRLAEGNTLLGRGQDLAIRTTDEGVSRQHARIVVDAGQVFVEDLGSVNGTFVNGELVRIARLKEGDHIRLGPSGMLKFIYADAAEESFQRQMHEAALVDPMTGVFNRAYLDQRLVAEVAFSARHHSPVGVIMIDVDRFKAINDTFGHLAGDEVLRQVAQRIQRTLRAEDMVARYGGEEFCVLCRGIRATQVLQLAERLRAAIEHEAFEHASHNLAITVSAGVATYPETRFDSIEDLVGAADAALLCAKAAGRNCCVVSPSDVEMDADPPTERFDMRTTK